MLITSLANAGYFRPIDIKHPQTSLGVFSDLKSHSDTGANLALITHSTADGCIIPNFCIPWTPLAIGGSFGKELGGPSITLGASANLLPGVEAGMLAIINKIFPADTDLVTIKTVLKPSIAGSPDVAFAVGPHLSLVFYDGLNSRLIFTIFSGAAWKF
jgi:hypothetical protein